MDTGVKKYNIQLTSSPSYLVNNLSTSDQFYVYATNAEPAPRCFVVSSEILDKGETSTHITKAAYKDLVEIQQTALLTIAVDGAPQTYLVLCTLDKLLVFNHNGTRLLAHFP